jgi:hypothetical protein
MDSSTTDTVGRPHTGYAGDGRLDLPRTPDGTIPTVVDTAAQTGALDAGDAPPMSWRDVAFPNGGSGGSGAEAATSPGTVGAIGTPVDRNGSADGDDGANSGPSDDSNSGGPNSGDGSRGAGRTGAGNTDGGTGLGTAVQDLGDGVGGPVGGVVGVAGGAVSGLGAALAGDEPSVIGNLTGGLLS